MGIFFDPRTIVRKALGRERVTALSLHYRCTLSGRGFPDIGTRACFIIVEKLHYFRMLSEFDLIDRFFLQRARSARAHGRAAHLGIGDDCALLRTRAGADYAVSTDMLVSGRHFLPDVDPFWLGHKSLAVNLSDLAAMGATPAGFTLSLALPEANPTWLEGFSAGLFALAERYDCELVGGDTTAGPLTISITIFGDVPHGLALRRDGARVGDDIWVSGMLGDARLALGLMRGDWRSVDDGADAPNRAADVAVDPEATLPAVRDAMEMPTPRIALGEALRGIGHAAIDLSDGLTGDLAHILRRSGVAARVDIDAIPRSRWLAAQPPGIQRTCTLAGGDDYELCFTAPAAARERIVQAGLASGVAVTRIGDIVAASAQSESSRASVSATIECDSPQASASETAAPHSPGHIVWTDGQGQPLRLTLSGFDHFHGN